MGHKKMSGDDECAHYLDCGYGFTGIFICQNLPNCTH
jgi:hypothetical protein